MEINRADQATLGNVEKDVVLNLAIRDALAPIVQRTLIVAARDLTTTILGARRMSYQEWAAMLKIDE